MQKTVQEMAEAALRALLRVIVETSCSHVLSRFSCNGQLQKRVPGYRYASTISKRLHKCINLTSGK